MNNSTATAIKNFTTIDHVARLALNLTANEYMVADLIYNLSNDPKSSFPGWCYASKKRIGSFFGLSERSIHSILTKLLKLGIVEKHEVTSHLRTTEIWYKNTVISDTEDSSPTLKILHPDTEDSSVGNTEDSSYYNNILDNNNNNILSPIVPSLKKYSSVKDLDENDFIDIAERYHVPQNFVELRYENLVNYCRSTGKRYKDYRSTLMNWVLRDVEKISRKVPRSVEMPSEI